MQLRKRTPQQAQRASKRASTSNNPCVFLDFPPEIIAQFGEKLSIDDLAAASAVCKSWAKHLRAGIKQARVIVCHKSNEHGEFDLDGTDRSGPPIRRSPAIISLARNSPSLSELQLLLCGRSSYAAVQESVSQLHSLQGLKKLRLSFLVSQTPKRGLWPMFFSDNMDIGRINCLVVESSSMPAIAITNLLNSLAGCKHLKNLQLLLGQPEAGSQLAPFQPPLWMQQANYTAATTTLSVEQLDQLAKLTSLEEVTLPIDPAVPQSTYRQLQKLKALTSLQLNGIVSEGQFQKLGLLKKLRKLAVMVSVAGIEGRLEVDNFTHVRDLSLGLAAGTSVADSSSQFLNQQLLGLSSGLSCSLRGLSLSGFYWSKHTPEMLAMLTALTSLQLLHVQIGIDAIMDGELGLDLTPLGKLRCIRKFTMHLPAPLYLQAKFGVASDQEKGDSQPAGKRGKRHKAPPSTKDLSGLLKVWPDLEALDIKHLTPAAVCNTCWDFRSLTALTSLCLQFTPAAGAIGSLLDDPLPVTQVDGAVTKLRVDQMPRQLKELQLTGAVLTIPLHCPFSDCLTSLSMSHCLLHRNWELQLSDPTIAGCRRSSRSSSARRNSAASDTQQQPEQQQPLVMLLRDLHCLQQLELVGLHHSQLSDSLLAAAAAAAAPTSRPESPSSPGSSHQEVDAPALSSLRGLTSLSILGVGNQSLSHGGLLGLTGLKKLRVLRWHVGDALELMPDMGALAQLKGLVALHIPTWLHAQMERWGAYAVLDSLPFCDVHVEAT